MNRRLPSPLPAMLALAGALAACAPQGSLWTPIETPKQNKVELATLRHEVRFAPGQDRPSPAEEERLRAFLARDRVGYGDRVVVPAARGATPAATQLAERQRAALAAYLRRQGLTVARTDPALAAVDPGATSRADVLIARHVVTPPACPDWSKDSRDDHTNTVASNFGCANVANLGLMVADPRDLIAGREPGPVDGAQAVLSIQRYRAGRVTPLLVDRDISPIQAAPNPQGAASAGAAP